MTDAARKPLRDLLRSFAQCAESDYRPGSLDSSSLTRLTPSGIVVHPSVVEYFDEYVPARDLDTDRGDVGVLLGADRIEYCSKDPSCFPSCIAWEFGFVAIGITCGGGTYSVDLTDGSVVLMSPEVVHWDYVFMPFGVKPTTAPLSRESILASDQTWFDSIEEYLEEMVRLHAEYCAIEEAQEEIDRLRLQDE